MAKKNDVTTSFKVDISDLKKSMQEAKRQVALANSEFKAVASTMDDWSKSSDGLKAKLKQLDSNLKSQKNILKSLEDQYELTVKEMGEGSKAADDLKIKINNQKSVINKTERELNSYEQTLEEVKEAEEKAAKSGKSVADILEDVGDEAEDAGEGFTVFKGAMADFTGGMLTDLAGGLKGLITNLINLGTETREYRTEMSKLDTAFSEANFKTEQARKVYKKLYAVLGDEGQAVEAANFLAKLVDTEEELTKWTKIATGVYGTFGNSLPIESLTEASNETAKTGQLTGALADALNWAGVNEDDFQASLDACTSEQERQAKITDTLNDLYSSAAEKYEKANKSVMDARKVSSDYSDTLADLGEQFEPLQTRIDETKTALLKKLAPAITEDVVPAMEDLMDELVEGEAFDEFTDSVVNLTKNVLKGFGKMLGFVIDNFDELLTVTSAAVGTYGAFKAALSIKSTITAVRAALASLSVSATAAAKAQTALNVAMSANVIGAVVSGVGLLVTGLVGLASSTGNAKKEQDLLTESQRAAITKGEELVEAYRETVAAADELAAAEIAQIDYTNRLWLELQELANANGEVQDKDKARAEFILGELNEALGTEYAMNGNIIGQYSDMVTSIESLIATKKAQILLQAYEESYAQAVQNSAELEKARSIAAQELYAQEQVALEKKQAAEVLYEQWKGEFDARSRAMYKQMYDDAQREYEDSAALLKKKQKKYDETSQAVNDAYNLIDSYETASTLVLKGETQQAIQLLNRYGDGFITAASMVNKSKKEQLATLRQQVIDTEVTLGILEAEYEAAQESMTDEEKRQAQLRIDNARKQAAAAKEEYAAVGGNMVDGLVRGVDGKSWTLSDSLKDTVNSAVAAAKKALGIHSPSRVLRDEVGKMMPKGVAVGVEDEKDSVLSSMRDLTSSAVSVARESLGAASVGLAGAAQSVKGTSGGDTGGSVINNNFYQTNNSPKALSRLDIYRQSKNLLGYAGGVR